MTSDLPTAAQSVAPGSWEMGFYFIFSAALNERALPGRPGAWVSGWHEASGRSSAQDVGSDLMKGGRCREVNGNLGWAGA